MATPGFGEAEFLFGHCPVCQEQVLTYTDFAPDDCELRRCLRCETIIASDLQATTTTALEGQGYRVVTARTCGDGGGCGASGCGTGKR